MPPQSLREHRTPDCGWLGNADGGAVRSHYSPAESAYGYAARPFGVHGSDLIPGVVRCGHCAAD